MHRIVVGVDSSPAAQQALAWAAHLAGRTGAELVAVRVFSTSQAEIAPDLDAALHRDEAVELEQWCADLPSGAARPRTLVVDGSPPDALLAAAEAQQADLLVVGGRGAGGFVHLHLGSVAHHLTHHTTLPLAIVPETGAGPVERLVVGVDGSPGAAQAIALCADLAAALTVPVTAVYAFEPLVEWVPENDPASWHQQAEADARTWAAPVEKAGASLEVDVDRDTHPVAALARALDRHAGSVAVVGSRGLGGFSGLRLGRVPLQLVHHTGAAVIVVPSRAEAPTT